MDLPQKLRKRTKKKRVRENKKVLDGSITQRPESIERREEFGHWEIDSVIGILLRRFIPKGKAISDYPA